MDIVTMGALMGKINGAKAEMKNSMDTLKSAMSIEKTAESESWAGYVEIPETLMEDIESIEADIGVYQVPAPSGGNVYYMAGSYHNKLVPTLNNVKYNNINGVAFELEANGKIKVRRTYNDRQPVALEYAVDMPLAAGSYNLIGTWSNYNGCSVELTAGGSTYTAQQNAVSFQMPTSGTVTVKLLVGSAFSGIAYFTPAIIESMRPATFFPVCSYGEIRKLYGHNLYVEEINGHRITIHKDLFDGCMAAAVTENPADYTVYDLCDQYELPVDAANWVEDTDNQCFRLVNAPDLYNNIRSYDDPISQLAVYNKCTAASYVANFSGLSGWYYGRDSTGFCFGKLSNNDTLADFLQRLAVTKRYAGSIYLVYPRQTPRLVTISRHDSDFWKLEYSGAVIASVGSYSDVSLGIKISVDYKVLINASDVASALADLEARVAALEAANNT